MAQPLEEGSLSPNCGMSHYAGNTLVTAPTEWDVGETCGNVISAMREHGCKTNPWGAQQSHTVKWECRISMKAKPGPHKISVSQEKIAQIGLSNATQLHLVPLTTGCAQEAPRDDHLTSEQRQHVLFTDGSAKYVEGDRW